MPNIFCNEIPVFLKMVIRGTAGTWKKNSEQTLIVKPIHVHVIFSRKKVMLKSKNSTATVR